MKINYIILTCVVVLSQMSCKKYVQIDAPPSLLVTAKVFSNDATATSAMTSIYTAMMPESFNMSQNTGLLSDELNGQYSLTGNIIQYYRNNMVSTNTTAGPWISAYSYIYQCNAIIESLRKYEGVSERAKAQLLGEAKFVRAFWHFYLTNCYGDVPIVTTTDYTVNSTALRMDQSKVYQQIIADLQDARGLLSDHYIDATDSVITSERIRPTRWAALAMLARVALYTKDYATARSSSAEIMSNTTLYKLTDSLNTVFLANSTEAIWQLAVKMPNTANINTIDGYSFILTAAPTVSGTNTATISAQLFNAFDSADSRKRVWIGNISTGANNYYFPYKYQVYQSSSIKEYTMMLRLAEQYLIHAEASAQLDDMDAAIVDLNIIRKRAGLADYNGSKDKIEVLKAILHERQVELFAEWGHRWFDLIRTGNINDIMTIVAPMKGGDWTPDARLFPIPQVERLADDNLTQNPGYF